MKAIHRYLVVASVALFSLVVTAIAGATTYDLSPATTGITAQITDSLGVVLPIAGGLLGLFLGWRIVKRFVH